MTREMWSQLQKFSDGENLDANTLNVPIGQLGDRTEYLYARLKELLDTGKMSSVILTDVRLSVDEGREPNVGNAVYLDNETGRFAVAKATMSLYDDFTAAHSAFTVGILQTKNGDSGNVLVYGSLNLNPDGSPMLVSEMIESGEVFRPGRYYLSANEAGKLTAHPNGPLIYVCTINATVVAGGMNGTAIVTPQFLDIGTSHVHRTAVLTARPAGTKSTAGYLPIDATFTTAQVGPLALRFGGTWTSDVPVDYEFFLNQTSADWPDGVILHWRENGKGNYSMPIPAPDAEVRLSHGLTVRLSLPASDSTHAYSGLPEDKRTWPALTFPDAGRGWLDHEATAIAQTPDVDGLRIAVRGNFGRARETVHVAFPQSTQILTAGTIADGSQFVYGGTTYWFVTEGTYIAVGAVPVDLGPCLADSVRNLCVELNKSGNGTFAVFESESGKQAKMLAMDALEIEAGENKIFTQNAVRTGAAFDVVGATAVKAVVFDSRCVVIGANALMENLSSYGWMKSGALSLMIYQDADGTVTVPTGTLATGELLDDEPDSVYDYVIGMDAQVANYWPPVPPKSAALLVNGVEMDNQALVPEHPTVAFGRKTIHWFANDRGRKPWPEGFLSRDTAIDPAYDKVEILHWVRGFQGATGPVTSLQVKKGSAIKIVGYGTEDVANTGDLEIEADLDFQIVGGGTPGFMVPKRASGGRLLAGPVVERIVGGPGVSVISGAGCPAGQGTVVIALDNGAYVNQFSDIALENAEQAKIGMFPYIRLAGYTGSITSPSAFTATMRVPNNLPDGLYALNISASVFGETGFTGQAKRSACVKFAYNILPDFSARDAMRYKDLKTSLLKPDSDRTVLIPFGHADSGGIVYKGFDPILISTEDENLVDADDVVAKVLGKRIPDANDFALQTAVVPELRPGYLVGIRISRAVTSAEGVEPYTSAIGIINLSWSLVSSEGYGTVPRKLDDIYARNTSTGLFHAVLAVQDDETGRVDLGVDQEGVSRN